MDSRFEMCPECGAELGGMDEEGFEEGYVCPECGQVYTDPVPKCSQCGTEFELGEEEEFEEFKCPDCGSYVTSWDEFCPECGLDFEQWKKQDSLSSSFVAPGKPERGQMS